MHILIDIRDRYGDYFLFFIYYPLFLVLKIAYFGTPRTLQITPLLSFFPREYAHVSIRIVTGLPTRLLCKTEGKDQESIQSSTTPDPGYELESDNVTIRHHK